MKNTLKRIIQASLILFITINIFSCSNDDDAPQLTPQQADVYVAGYQSNGTNKVATVWKNGTATNLTDGSNDASAKSVVVSGDDVYVVGTEYNGTKRVAKLWKNGIATDLTDGLNHAETHSIFVK